MKETESVQVQKRKKKIDKTGMGKKAAEALYEKTRDYVFYYHNVFFRTIADMAMRSRIPSYQWDRIETQLCVKYGMKKVGGLYVQEEIKKGKDGLYRRVGISQLYKDFIDTIDEDFNEIKGKRAEFVKHYARTQIGFRRTQGEIRAKDIDEEDARNDSGDSGNTESGVDGGTEESLHSEAGRVKEGVGEGKGST